MGSEPHTARPPARREARLLSVVAPVHDEQENLREFCGRVIAALGDRPLEIIVVDDGSGPRPTLIPLGGINRALDRR